MNSRNNVAEHLRVVRFDKQLLKHSWVWLQDEELLRITRTQRFTKRQQLSWFAKLHGRTDYFVWGIECNGDPIGAFGIKGIKARSGEYWGYIGEKKYRGRGIGKWMMKEAIKQAREIGLTRLYLSVLKENTRAIKLYKKIGFKVFDSENHVYWMEREI